MSPSPEQPAGGMRTSSRRPVRLAIFVMAGCWLAAVGFFAWAMWQIVRLIGFLG